MLQKDVKLYVTLGRPIYKDMILCSEISVFYHSLVDLIVVITLCIHVQLRNNKIKIVSWIYRLQCHTRGKN